MKEVIEYYNKGQKKRKITNICYDEVYKEWCVDMDDNYFSHTQIISIGFYEWLFNPKYKVFEVFKIQYVFKGIILSRFNKPYKVKQPEQILKYLAEGIK